ncbi:MAG: aminotransferase class III-fold pyridoxal phosphate-dependent enzyme [Desulfobacteraceae bacterium]|nr:aminotransferase class III-fold pyridoxal phosphate-dependent enzyme [Desulfobacteraceae bacterium]
MKKNELIQIADKTLLKVTNRPEIVMDKGEGLFLFDTEGNRYLDFIGGWAVNCLGHSPKVISDVLTKQSHHLINASPSFYNLPMLEYADLLIKNCCFERVFFTSTGAEANEGAIKLARKFGAKYKSGAYEIITTSQGFHGRTLTTMSATGKKQWENLFEPKTKGFVKTIFNDFESVRQSITEKTCAILIEPIQGEGGINVASTNYIEQLYNLCSQENILLMFDEIQTGMGRTGKLFCYEHYGIEPDIMTLGKGIGGGFPLSALLAKERLNIFDPGDQGGTYTAQPLAMSVGLVVLKELLNNDLIAHCEKMGNLISQKLLDISKTHEIENIRGQGLLIAFDLNETKGSDLVDKCLKDKLIINSPKEKSIRLMPPLVVNEKEIEEMLEVIKSNLAKRKTT